MVTVTPVLRPTSVGFCTLATRILMVLEELQPEKLLVNLMVRLAGAGGLATLLPNCKKHTSLLSETSALVFHYLQSRLR